MYYSGQNSSWTSDMDRKKLLYFGKNLKFIKNAQLVYLRNSQKALEAHVK